jgi:hypothetical protein
VGAKFDEDLGTEDGAADQAQKFKKIRQPGWSGARSTRPEPAVHEWIEWKARTRQA